jgi:hypothetical protein
MMLILQHFLIGLHKEIILSFSPGHLLFSKNRFSLACMLTFESQYSHDFAFLLLTKVAPYQHQQIGTIMVYTLDVLRVTKRCFVTPVKFPPLINDPRVIWQS